MVNENKITFGSGRLWLLTQTCLVDHLRGGPLNEPFLTTLTVRN